MRLTLHLAYRVEPEEPEEHRGRWLRWRRSRRRSSGACPAPASPIEAAFHAGMASEKEGCGREGGRALLNRDIWCWGAAGWQRQRGSARPPPPPPHPPARHNRILPLGVPFSSPRLASV